MDIADQVAIHEAMEQQTISIAKAGIPTTLNARASILAAANPIGGRYNPKTTLKANLNFSAPIMSRFDLFFVIRDDPNENVDRNLASHIVNVHMNRDEAVEPDLSTEQLQRYIRFARTFRPVFTDEAKVFLVEKYKELRANDAQGGMGRSSYRITVRQLESLIRLSEAVAKVNCVGEIVPKFVKEAYDLLRQSIVTVEKDDIEVDDDEEAALAQQTADAVDDEEMADGDRDGDEAMRDGDGDQQDQAARSKAKAKTKITYDKYMKILNLVVRRINEDESRSGEGVEQEELLIWYLEQIESELNNEEDLQNERGLVLKVLKRMVKVCLSCLSHMSIFPNVLTSSFNRITFSCLFVEKVFLTVNTVKKENRTRLSTSCIQTVRLRMWKWSKVSFKRASFCFQRLGFRGFSIHASI